MEVAGSLLLDVVNRFCSWIPVRAEPPPMSRDFWMPDESCRVCYECDSPFTLFNRRHHCRICGRIFCGKCTLNTLPGIACRPGIYEDGERVRVCNFCFKIKQEEARKEEEQKVVKPPSPTITPSSSSFSLASSSTSGSSTTSSSSSSSVNTAQIPASYGYRTSTTTRMDSNLEKKHRRVSHTGRSSRRPLSPRGRDPSPNPYDFCSNRSDDDETDDQKVAAHHDKGVLGGQTQDEEEDDSCVEAELPNANNVKYHQNLEYMVVKINGGDEDNKQNEDLALKLNSTPVVERSLSKRSAMSSDDYDGLEESMDESNLYTPSLFQEPMPTAGEELVDVENNDLIWVPPPPEDEDDEMGMSLVDDDDDDIGWGSLSSSEYRSREKAAASDEQRRAMRAVVDGHFRALVGQLLDGEGLEVEESEKEGWLGIVSALALQAASLIKPDTSKDGGMDPGGYVKVKCIAAGHRSESRVVKGIVCKKNVANRRMTPRFKNPRILLLGGALEYQRVSNQLSSLDTLLQQEKDHISMIVARIEAHHPNVVLVEKNVSGQAQEWLLAKGISLVQNVRRPLLERIARCTGAEIVPSSDHLLKSICGHCELFFVEKFVEDLGTSGQGGKKSPKTLMFYEGCPRPLGCTVLLKGASEDELKKVKRVVQYAVFAAYQLALETSFLVDEGATLPELPFKSPISVALPDKQSKFDKSITTVPGFLLSGQTPSRESQVQQNHIVDTHSTLPVSAINIPRWRDTSLKMSSSSIWSVTSSCVSSRTNSPNTSPRAGDYHDNGFGRKHFGANNVALNVPGRAISTFPTPTQPKVLGPPNSNISDPSLSPSKVFIQPNSVFFVPGENSTRPVRGEYPNVQRSLQYMDGNFSETTQSGLFSRSSTPLLEEADGASMAGLHKVDSDVSIVQGSQFAASGEAENNITWEDNDANHEEFPPSPSDHQSILVSFSSSCLRKGTVCERGLLFRIKYYGSFDKPLGKFLRDNVFDLSNVCGFCEETRDAHLHCYMHRQGSLTISVHRQKQVLPGERDGKIWMWHRCLKCSRLNGVPPSTHRVLMSDAAWGLSFGKFLELSFSNHAAASRLAACGHSLHRDCLRFYGFGSMVACFRYAPINVHSVFLPPSMLEFNNPELNEWLQNEVREVTDRGKLMFAEAFNTLRQIEEKVSSYGSAKAPEARRRIAEFESLLINDQKSFVEALQIVAPSKREPGSLYADILELNSTRRNLAILSAIWHKRFLHLLAFLRLQKSTPISRSANLDDPSTLFSKTDIVTELGRTDDNAKGLCNGSTQDGSEQNNMVQAEGGEISSELHNGIMPPSDQVRIHTPNDLKPDDGSKLESSDSGSHYAVNVSSAVDQSTGSGIPVSPKKSVGDATATTLLPSSPNFSLTKEMDSTNKLVEEKDSFQFHVPEDDLLVRRTLSEGQFPILPPDLPHTYETVWTGKGHSIEAHTVNITSSGQEIVSHGSGSDLGGASEDSSKLSNVRSVESINETTEQKPGLRSSNSLQEMSGSDCDPMVASSVTLPAKTGEMLEGFGSWAGTPFSSLYRSYSKGSQNGLADSPPTMGSPLLYNTSTMLLPGREARVLLPIGIDDTVIPVYDDEPTSVIAYAITSHQYQDHLLDRSPEKEKSKEREEVEGKREAAKSKDTDVTTTEDVVSHPLQFVEGSFEHGDGTAKNRSVHIDENPQARIKESGNSQYFKATHVKVSFSDDGAPGKMKYTVTCYYAKQFDALRKKCCPNQMEFVRSLCRCKKWGAQGGKSNVFFAKTADDRFVIKQVTKTELESFIKFAPQYFQYLSDALTSGSPTCLAKILGIFQVTIKHGKNGREVRMDLMAMENLLYGRHVTRLYDLKGSLRSRYNADVTGTNKVLLDQNLLESMLTNPIFIGNKAKRILERAVWNDTSFLASVDVMDYSLLVGVDEERRELVLGIIDFMRQYTWDKHLETWVKASGILGGPKNATPTVISPKQYKKRFRKAMKNYFLMVPDQWSPPTEIFGSSQVDSTSNESATAVKEQVSDEKVM